MSSYQVMFTVTVASHNGPDDDPPFTVRPMEPEEASYVRVELEKLVETLNSQRPLLYVEVNEKNGEGD